MALNDGKLDATIVDVRPSFAFAEAGGIRYFIFATACETTGRYDFEDLIVGAQVRLRPIDHPRGPRGIEVEILALRHVLDGR